MLDWRTFLSRWSRELMNTELASRVEPRPDSPDWLGYAPASEEEVRKLEVRLGLTLPPSYRAFLLTSNGWRRTTPFIGNIRPAGEVTWLRLEDEFLVELYSEHGSELPDEEYFDYTQYSELHYRAEHVKSLIKISDYDDGMYLLNPEAMTPDGEWEAWFFANWVPGPQRCPSFAHLMLHDYRSFAELEKVHIRERDLPKLAMPDPAEPRVVAKRTKRTRPKAPSWESLILQMRTSDGARRAQAVRSFSGKLRGRPRAERRPDLVPQLVDLFYAAEDPEVRAACVAGLTEMADDSDAPKPLLYALTDGDPQVILHGMFALTYFPNRQAVEPLCAFIRSKINVLYNETAMSELARLGDERAVPALVEVLFDTSNTFNQSFGTAALTLAQCGESGFQALVRAAVHPDARVRHAAACGLDVSGDSRAGVYLDRLADDSDEKVSTRARQRLGRMWE